MDRPERERLRDRTRFLEKRAQLNRYIRRFFEERGFLEIEAPIVVPSPGLELHLDAFELKEETLYLITSPEYQMKRLLGGGLARIYSLGKVFRRGELGAHHNPEFTMLEWYRAGEGWERIAEDVESLVEGVAEALFGTTRLAGLELARPWRRKSVRELLLEEAGVELWGDEPVESLRTKLQRAGHRLPASGSFSDLFFTVWLDVVEPVLARSPQPVIVFDWPRPLCALARAKPSDPRVVERFEAFAGGLELCNGFGELIDSLEQRERLEADLAERRALGKPLYPIDEKFLRALDEMSPSAGVALGVDRLAMLLLGATDIRDVLPFKFDEL
jgi:lysyl-tRNA synthetase class 2